MVNNAGNCGKIEQLPKSTKTLAGKKQKSFRMTQRDQKKGNEQEKWIDELVLQM